MEGEGSKPPRKEGGFRDNKTNNNIQTMQDNMQTRFPSSKSGQIEFLVQKNAQCSEIYAKTIFRFFFAEQNFPLKFQGQTYFPPNFLRTFQKYLAIS